MLELHDKDLKSAMISNGDADIGKRFFGHSWGERRWDDLRE